MSVTLQLERLAVDLVQEGAPKLRRAAGLVDDGLLQAGAAGNVELVSCREFFEKLQVGGRGGFGQVDAPASARTKFQTPSKFTPKSAMCFWNL